MSQSIFAKTIKDERLGEMISPYQKALLEAYIPIVDKTKSMAEYTTVLEDPTTQKVHYIMAWTHGLGDKLKTAYDVLKHDKITVDELEAEEKELSKLCTRHKFDPKKERHGGI